MGATAESLLTGYTDCFDRRTTGAGLRRGRVVDVYAEKGSGLETLVGLGLPDLAVGQLLTDETIFITRDGDINQEDLTNDAVGAWRAMACFHFSLTDNPGVDHFALPNNPAVLSRLIADANRPRSACP
ncbi:MAG: hypothetical protein MSC30_01140 [Gaiellaceae bacterium MAG52_C11]|nr:hypothetical protein [Candidatus Gaiellasilicea maunaloa]